MDKIYFNGMEFYGYHGVFPEENKLGQRYIVDIELYLDLSRAAQTDDLEHTINYAQVYELCKNIVENETFQLVEKVAQQIAERSLQQFHLLDELMVRVTKPDPPIAGHYDSVAVEIRRGR
ncbi:dihydroneopterin aldolase [Ammoniphilus sp. CFH 90114]|uniref:dihydroneopterin aldolase n=1 Tax=Ammoniphilus sp. CFH 90114 TaxID=2493665 RepID=UPI00100E9F3E|nr:dihydroneopterin aldolase [Ammoniphilus sp. CFH 90114]RXT09030.1 dihydroneopterin aldolase [Ammoniphilus sp. CFH 90114]